MPYFTPQFRGYTSPLTRAITGYAQGGGVAFVPASIFGASDRGGVYDMTGAAPMYQATDTSSSVTTAGQFIQRTDDTGPLGKNATAASSGARSPWLGHPRTFGTDLAANGSFATDTVWTKGTGWTIASGKATKTAGTASAVGQAITLTAGQCYVVTFNSRRTAGTLTARLTGGTTVEAADKGLTSVAGGSYDELFVAATGNTTLEFYGDAAFAGSVADVTCRPVTAWAMRGARFDAAAQVMTTAAIDMTNSNKVTLVLCYTKSKDQRAGVATSFGNQYAGNVGAINQRFGPQAQIYARGTTGMANSDAAYAVSTQPYSAGSAVCIYEVDFGASGAAQMSMEVNGVVVAGSVPAAMGGGMLGNLPLTLGGYGGTPYHDGLIHRAMIINRVLTPGERASVRTWAKSGGVFGAVLGDSTVGVQYDADARVSDIASHVPGLLALNNTNVAVSGEKIAEQKTHWTAIADKSALQAVFVQIGLNDVKGRVGGGLATTAQVIADLQDLVTTIRSGVSTGCKIYVSQLTPCKGWLDAAALPAAAYAAWQDVNTAIAGGGATPITGVDGRITAHSAQLNDGSGYLKPEFNMFGDGVHEGVTGRMIIGQAWRTQLEADGLV